MKVCCVSQHIAAYAHGICEKASREINNSKRHNKKSSQKYFNATAGRSHNTDYDKLKWNCIRESVFKSRVGISEMSQLQKSINDCTLLVITYRISAKSSTELKELQCEGKSKGEEEEWVVFQNSRQRERQLRRLEKSIQCILLGTVPLSAWVTVLSFGPIPA